MDDDPLARLAEYLRGLHFDAALADGRLTVSPPNSPSTLTVRCRPRPDDGGRLWFYTDAAVPLAETDQLINAVTAVRGHLPPAP